MALELDILRLYEGNLRGFYTIRALAQKLALAYPYVHRCVHQLLAIGVLRTVMVGGSHCLSVDLRNRRAILYLTELELEKRASLPEAVKVLAEQLDRDGTLVIETAVYSAGTIYIVGSGSYPGATTISREEFLKLLLTANLFHSHVVLYGYERFFSLLASKTAELDERFNPLVTVRP